MKMYYTDRWNGFQIESPTYLDGHFEPDIYSIVKWEDNKEPMEVLDWSTGEKKMQKEYCFVIAEAEWNKKEECFEFRSVGLRYLKYRIDGLEEWIMDFLEKEELRKTEE